VRSIARDCEEPFLDWSKGSCVGKVNVALIVSLEGRRSNLLLNAEISDSLAVGAFGCKSAGKGIGLCIEGDVDCEAPGSGSGVTVILVIGDIVHWCKLN